jgi:hypothetical protein
MLQLTDFLKVGLDTIEIDDQVFLIRNFIRTDELQVIRAKLSTFNEESWIGYYMDHLRDRAQIEYGTRDVEKLQADGLMEVTNSWADKNIPINEPEITAAMNKRLEDALSSYTGLLVKGFGTVQRQYEGAELKSHVDAHSDPTVAYAAVAYITDDYTDGELFFVGRDLKIKPEAGSLIVFPGTEGYEHGVIAPGPGPIRYVFPSFVHSRS